MQRRKSKLWVIVLVAVCALPAYSQTIEQETSDHESASGRENAHESHNNAVALFAGITHAGRRKNGAALGVAYERLLNESFSIGVLAEHTFGEADFTVYAVPIDL